jgi:hypothetical protein
MPSNMATQPRFDKAIRNTNKYLNKNEINFHLSIQYATVHIRFLSSRCERSPSNYALAGACPERGFVQS